MQKDEFREALVAHFGDFQKVIASDVGDWTVKGFIDMYKNIYTISVDTKVCLLYTSPSPRDRTRSRMPSSA